MTPEERDKFMYERGQRDMQRRCAEVAFGKGRTYAAVGGNAEAAACFQTAAAIEALDVEESRD